MCQLWTDGLVERCGWIIGPVLGQNLSKRGYLSIRQSIASNICDLPASWFTARRPLKLLRDPLKKCISNVLKLWFLNQQLTMASANSIVPTGSLTIGLKREFATMGEKSEAASGLFSKRWFFPFQSFIFEWNQILLKGGQFENSFEQWHSLHFKPTFWFLAKHFSLSRLASNPD